MPVNNCCEGFATFLESAAALQKPGFFSLLTAKLSFLLALCMCVSRVKGTLGEKKQMKAIVLFYLEYRR